MILCVCAITSTICSALAWKGDANTSVCDDAAVSFSPLFVLNLNLAVWRCFFPPLVLLRNQSVTFRRHQASYGNKTEADVSDWCCCWSSFSFYQSWRTKNVADGVSERKGCSCFTAVWLCQVGTLPWTVCNGTMTPRPCRPSCQLEASDTSSHSNVVVFHGLFPRQSFGSLLSAVCWKSTWPPLEAVWEFFYSILQIFYTSHLTLMYRSADRLCSPQTVAVITTYKSKQCQVIISNPQGL